MAIIKVESLHAEIPEEKQLLLKFYNGDLQVLEEIMKKWRFKNEESLIRFALAILLKAEKNRVLVEDESGKSTYLAPADSLLNKKPSLESDSSEGENSAV